MSATDHASLLTRLISLSELTLQMRNEPDRELLIDLVAFIENESRKPVDGPRVMADEVVMCAQAVLHADRHLRSYSRAGARPFCQVVGVLLPEVRGALGLAIEQRRRPTP